MANIMISRLTNSRIFFGVIVSFVQAAMVYAQAPQHLQVELTPKQQITILGSDVSYGEILRALQKKLRWEIEIPAIADELKLSSVHIDAMQPLIALAKLLEGSGLGYATMLAENKSQSVKVIVTPKTPPEANVTNNPVSGLPISHNATADSPLPTPPPVQPLASVESSVPTPGADREQFGGLPTVPLSEAVNTMGVPPGMSPVDVGSTGVFPISEAARMMGNPSGTSPTDVGSTMAFPISEAARMMGNPPGISPSDVGKTNVLPLPTGSGKHP